jgi:O-antigen ligase
MKRDRLEKIVEASMLTLAFAIPFSAACRIKGYPAPLSALWGAGIVILSLGVLLKEGAISDIRRIVPAGGPARRLAWSALVFLAVCGVSGFGALNSRLWAKELVQFILFFSLVFAIWLLALRRFSIKAYGLAVLLAATAVSVVGIIQYFWGVDLGLKHFTTEGGRIRAFGGLQFPNKLGVYLAGVVPLGLAFGVRGDRLGRTAFLLCVPILACLVLTLSRSAWIGGMVGIVIFLLMQGRTALRPVLYAGCLSVLFAGLMVVDNHARKGNTVQEGGRQIVALSRDVDANRAELLRLGARLIAEKPLSLGIGLGNSERIIQPEAEQMSLDVPEGVRSDLRGAGSFHNTPVQLYVETGPLGVFAALCVLYFFFRTVRAAPKAVRERPEFAGLAACVGVIVATGAFDWLWTRGTGDMMFYASGLLLAWIRNTDDENGAGS